MTGLSTVVASLFCFAVESFENATVFGSGIVHVAVSVGVFLIIVAIAAIVPTVVSESTITASSSSMVASATSVASA